MPDYRKRLLALAGLVVIVGVAVWSLLAAGILGNQSGGKGIDKVRLLDPPPAQGQEGLEVGPQVGKLAPNFEVSDLDGSRHRLSDFRGRPVYINFWATWCLPCVVELPDIQELQDRHPELAVIAVNRGDSLESARKFLAGLERRDGGRGLSFTVNAMDPTDALYNAYRGLGMPVSIFIDAAGRITAVHNGLLRLDQMEEAYREAVRQGGASYPSDSGAAPPSAATAEGPLLVVSVEPGALPAIRIASGTFRCGEGYCSGWVYLALKELPGVTRVRIDAESRPGAFVVEYDPDRVTIETIAETARATFSEHPDPLRPGEAKVVYQLD